MRFLGLMLVAFWLFTASISDAQSTKIGGQIVDQFNQAKRLDTKPYVPPAPPPKIELPALPKAPAVENVVKKAPEPPVPTAPVGNNLNNLPKKPAQVKELQAQKTVQDNSIKAEKAIRDVPKVQPAPAPPVMVASANGGSSRPAASLQNISSARASLTDLKRVSSPKLDRKATRELGAAIKKTEQNLAKASTEAKSVNLADNIKSQTDASSAVNKVKLEKKLASEEQLAQLSSGDGTVISQPAKQANRIASQTGRNPADIQKVSSDARISADGQHVETHSFRDASDNTLIEPKTIIDPTKE